MPSYGAHQQSIVRRRNITRSQLEPGQLVEVTYKKKKTGEIKNYLFMIIEPDDVQENHTYVHVLDLDKVTPSQLIELSKQTSAGNPIVKHYDNFEVMLLNIGHTETFYERVLKQRLKSYEKGPYKTLIKEDYMQSIMLVDYEFTLLQRSPKGGVTINDKYYRGGQLLPAKITGEDLQKAILERDENNL